MFDISRLSASINSGHAFEVSGTVDGLFFYVAKLPYENRWTGWFQDRWGSLGLRFKAEGDDAIEAINNGLELNRRLSEQNKLRVHEHPRVRYSYYDADCSACLRGLKHEQWQHEVNLQRVRAASYGDR